MTEWLQVPAGMLAQVMGHKPSATAAKQYAVRLLDLLLMHHEKTEAFILDSVKVELNPEESVSMLRVVAAAQLASTRLKRFAHD